MTSGLEPLVPDSDLARRPTTRLRAGPLEIDLPARQVHIGDRLLGLTAKEFDLLAYVATRPGHVFSREQLLQAVWQSASEWQLPTTVTEHVRRLRVKIEADPANPQLLRTVRGAGYRFDLPVSTPPGDPTDPLDPDQPGTVVHVDGRIVFADRRARAVLGGAGGADPTGCNIMDLIAPVSMDAARERVEAIAAGRSSRSQLLTFRQLDGSELLVELTSTTLDWHGEHPRSLGLVRAVDPAVRLRYLATGVHTEPTDAVIITDLDFHVRSWSRTAERLYGWTEQEAVGRHFQDLLPWTGTEADLLDVGESIRVSGRWTGETVQVGRDGSNIRVLASTKVVLDDSGEVVGFVSVNRPLPSRRQPARLPADLRALDQIRSGLDHDEFEVRYQPVVLLLDRRVIAVEALVRWHHPTRGLLLPEQFVGAAEDSGLLLEIGSAVLDQACAQVAAWRASGLELNLGVNLSTRQLSDPDLLDRIDRSLASSGLTPEALWLEVTETALVKEVEAASEVLSLLVDGGVHVAVDNFGTGWSSLAYLRRLPVHALKIDRSFVAGVGQDPFDTAYARSVIALGAELDLFIVAEGVETEAQHAALRRIGCTVGQGFLYGRPVPAAELTPALERAAAHRPDATPRAARAGDRADDDVVSGLRRELLRVESARDAADLLHQAARDLGGAVVAATEAGAGALPIDVSLGEGPPALVEPGPQRDSRTRLDRLLPCMVEDAGKAVELLRRTERPCIPPVTSAGV